MPPANPESAKPLTAAGLMRPFASDIHGTGPSVMLSHGMHEGLAEPMLAVWNHGVCVGRFAADAVGRVHPDDGIFALVAAFSRKGQDTWPIVIVGDGIPLGYIAQGDVMGAVRASDSKQGA